MIQTVDNLTSPISTKIANSFKNILFTGASGWLGREIMDVLNISNLVENNSNIIFCGSEEKIILHKNQEYHQLSLKNFNEQSEFDLIIHCAFLTQDKMQTLGLNAYREINTEITRKVSRIFQNGSPKLLALSSGAANPYLRNGTKSKSMIEYGLLKKEMEDSFLEVSELRVLISRIWNVSGKNIQEPSKYAIGDFIQRALLRQDIILKSNGQSKRSYMPAHNLFSNVFASLLNNDLGITNSGGVECSILELAKLTQSLLNPDKGQVHIPAEPIPDEDYVSPKTVNHLDTQNFVNSPLNLSAQILRTASSSIFVK